MTGVSAIRTNDVFRRAVEEAAASLVEARFHGSSAYVQVPLLYPSGSTAVVRVDGGPTEFFVTDFGSGHAEAEMMGGEHIYSRAAPNIAEQAGVRFDNHAFFLVEASREQLAGAVMTIANCALEAVTATAFKLAERKQVEDDETVYQRLIRVFDERIVAKRPEIKGSSNTAWHVSAAVRSEVVTLFDAVAAHHISVVNTSAKFQDVARLEKPPRRVAVVRSKAALTTYLGLLSQSSDVIEAAAADDVFRRLVRAA